MKEIKVSYPFVAPTNITNQEEFDKSVKDYLKEGNVDKLTYVMKDYSITVTEVLPFFEGKLTNYSIEVTYVLDSPLKDL